jgi:DNA-binding response OmpR family regulator
MSDPDRPGQIMIIDDDPTLADVVGRYLARDGHRAECVHDGFEALRRIEEAPPDLVILDLMLPGINGLEICRRLRARWPIPVVMLTALGEETDKIAGFETGADDYITKPFSPSELQARVRAQLRRSRLAPAAGATQVITIGELVIDPVKPSLKKSDVAVHLTKTEWELLRTLLKHAGRTLTHQQLFRAVWGNSSGDMQQYLRVHIRSLRRKIETDPVRPRLIVTEPGVGYRFENEP